MSISVKHKHTQIDESKSEININWDQFNNVALMTDNPIIINNYYGSYVITSFFKRYKNSLDILYWYIESLHFVTKWCVLLFFAHHTFKCIRILLVTRHVQGQVSSWGSFELFIQNKMLSLLKIKAHNNDL